MTWSTCNIHVTKEGIGSILVYPNPTPATFSVRISNPEQKAAFLKLFDSTGLLIQQIRWKEREMPETWEKQFTLQQKEIYLIMTQIGDQIETEKISVVDWK